MVLEWNPHCIEVLCNMKYGEEWVAFEDRFDASVCNHFKALEKAAGDVAAARVEAYCEMRDYLRSLSEESFRPNPPVMWCHRCKKLCDIKDLRLKDTRKQNGQCFLSFKKLQTSFPLEQMMQIRCRLYCTVNIHTNGHL